MNLRDLWEQHQKNAREASATVRHIGFAGIAMIWVLRPADAHLAILSMVVPGALIVVGLGLDVAHLLVLRNRWKGLEDEMTHRYRAELDRDTKTPEERRTLSKEMNEREFDLPPRFHFPGVVLFWLKLVFIGAAYVVLFATILTDLSTEVPS